MLTVILSVCALLFFGSLVMYNGKILSAISHSQVVAGTTFDRWFGDYLKRLHVDSQRAVGLKKGSLLYKADAYLKEIIVNLGMTKDNVTPLGLAIFIGSISAAAGVVFAFWTSTIILGPLTFVVVAVFLVILFRFFALTRYEKQESEIMDTVDLLAMDIKDGVQNAVTRYREVFHPNVRPHFEEFLSNIQNQGYGFKDAMLMLNARLGENFTDFAQKAILYEAKADKDMDDIFSTIVEVNRYRRMLREESNAKFNSLRIEFLISVVIIASYGLFSVFTDAFLNHFFLDLTAGKVVLLADLLIITGVLSYISSIKAKFLN